MNIEHFIKRAKERHGDKYDYSKVEYINSKTYVEIVCPIHGSFLQLPCNHYKYVCKHCGHDIGSRKQRKQEDSFLIQAMNVHKNKYKYLTPYIKAHEKIIIECPVHGKFEQTPRSHLNGRGCHKCKQGVLHPRFGKPAPATGYYGRYKENTFRSFSELFWMLEAESKNIKFIALDQIPNREKWQVFMTIKNKQTTYCPDFFVYSINTVIDIKPFWRIPREKEKLDFAKKHYESMGKAFEIIDCNSIDICYKKAFSLYQEKQIWLYPKSEARLLHQTKNLCI